MFNVPPGHNPWIPWMSQNSGTSSSFVSEKPDPKVNECIQKRKSERHKNRMQSAQS